MLSWWEYDDNEEREKETEEDEQKQHSEMKQITVLLNEVQTLKKCRFVCQCERVEINQWIRRVTCIVLVLMMAVILLTWVFTRDHFAGNLIKKQPWLWIFIIFGLLFILLLYLCTSTGNTIRISWKIQISLLVSTALLLSFFLSLLISHQNINILNESMVLTIIMLMLFFMFTYQPWLSYSTVYGSVILVLVVLTVGFFLVLLPNWSQMSNPLQLWYNLPNPVWRSLVIFGLSTSFMLYFVFDLHILMSQCYCHEYCFAAWRIFADQGYLSLALLQIPSKCPTLRKRPDFIAPPNVLGTLHN